MKEQVLEKMGKKVCAKCHGRQFVTSAVGQRAVAKVCDCVGACRDCEGRGYVYATQDATFSQKVGSRSYQTLVPCMCKVRQRRAESFSRANIPGVVAHATLRNFRPAFVELAKAHQALQQFTHEFHPSKPSRGFVLSGPVGTGKTHLMAAVLSELAFNWDVRVEYAEISLLYSQIRRGFQEGKSGGEIIQPLAEVDVLAIDELGKGRCSPFELETLDELVARRYNSGRTTLFSTNYSLDYPDAERSKGHGRGAGSAQELAQATKDSNRLYDRVTARIFSRLCEMCDFYAFPPDTPDHRRQKHEAAMPSRARAAS